MKTLRAILLPVIALTAIAAIIAGVVTGSAGVWGALLGGLVVCLFMGSTPVILTPAVKASPVLSLPVAVAFFTTKTASVVMVLALLFDVGGLADHVDRKAFGLAALAASLAWTVLQVLAFRRERVPVYDLGNND